MAATLAIAVFAFVLVAANVLKEVAGPFAAGHLTPTMVAYLVGIAIPGVLPYALPLGLLTAVLLVFGRLSAQNELVAMKAAGINLWRICAPVFLIAILGVVTSGLINVYYAPIADSAFRATLQSAAQADPLRFFSPRTFVKDFDDYVIFAERREGNELRNIHVWELDDQDRAIRHLQGLRALLDFDRMDAAIVLTVFDASGQIIDPELPPSEIDSSNILFFDRSEFRLPLEELLGNQPKQTKLAFQTLDNLMAERNDALALELSGSDPTAYAKRIELQTAIQKKFSFSFAVLSLCWIAIPLGIKASRTETYVNFALAFGLAVLYFLLFIVCSWTEKTPELRADLLIWTPNLIFQGLGLYLFLRAARR